MTKLEFMKNYSKHPSAYNIASKMVIALKLPTDAIELIINTDDIPSKFQYYLSAYDDNMQLLTNPKVRVIDAMFV